MAACYRFDPGQGRLAIQAFATGMLSILGHNPTFAAREFAGEVRLDESDGLGLSLDLAVRPDSLELIDRVKPADREEIVGRMRGEVLETRDFPEVAFRTVEIAADPVERGHYRVFLGGRLTLHGVTQPHGVDAELLVSAGRLRLRGGCTLGMSRYRIRPVTALGGAIRLKDDLRVSFDLLALPEAT